MRRLVLLVVAVVVSSQVWGSKRIIQVIRGPEKPTFPASTVGNGALGKVALKDLGKPTDPPEVAKAVEHRELEPQVALDLLKETWRKALKKKDLTLAAYALDRSGDLLMDLGARLDPKAAQLTTLNADEGVAPRRDACAAAHDDYVRAYGLAEVVGDRRLLGRIAHDIGWALERCSGSDTEAIGWYEVALAHRLAAHDAGGVRFSANNLGRIQADPKWRRHELYLLAAEGARVAQDWGGLRKIHGNLARLWFYSADAKWLKPGATTAAEEDYVAVPLKGEVRKKFLFHLEQALAAGKKADESPRTVCEGIQLYAGPACDDWGDLPPEKLFPEGCCGPTAE